jgi:hypothetical protein
LVTDRGGLGSAVPEENPFSSLQAYYHLDSLTQRQGDHEYNQICYEMDIYIWAYMSNEDAVGPVTTVDIMYSLCVKTIDV